MPLCINCGEPGEAHNWKSSRFRGRCPLGGLKYKPDTDKPRPVNKVLGRALYKRKQ